MRRPITAIAIRIFKLGLGIAVFGGALTILAAADIVFGL